MPSYFINQLNTKGRRAAYFINKLANNDQTPFFINALTETSKVPNITITVSDLTVTFSIIPNILGSIQFESVTKSIDKIDDNITFTKTESTPSTYTYTFTITDLDGNEKQYTREVILIGPDTTPPVFQDWSYEPGKDSINVIQNSTIDLGKAIFLDDRDGTIEVNADENTFKTSADIGEIFTLYYNAIDKAGNPSNTKQRTITIVYFGLSSIVLTDLGDKKIRVDFNSADFDQFDHIHYSVNGGVDERVLDKNYDEFDVAEYGKEYTIVAKAVDISHVQIGNSITEKITLAQPPSGGLDSITLTQVSDTSFIINFTATGTSYTQFSSIGKLISPVNRTYSRGP